MTLRHALQLGAFVVVGLLLPVLVPSLNLSLLIGLLLFAGWATSWDLLGGWTGQTSLGHAAFVGLGAYAVALLTRDHGLDAISAAQIGVVLAAGLAWVWGRLTFRLTGPYFTLSTIAVAEILRLVAINERWLTDGAQGVFLFSLPEPFGLDLFDREVQYVVALLYAAGLVALVMWLSGSRLGYRMRAVRENEAAAEAAGIDPTRVKLTAFVLSGALTALGGAIYGVFLSFLEPHGIFLLPLSVRVALTAIIGGRGTVWGPTFGAALLVLSAEAFRSVFAEANLLIYGVLIVVVILFLPRGLLGELERRLVQRRFARNQ